MRAAVMEGVRQPLVVREMPDPKPARDGVVVRVEANGICRSDWHLWTGDWSWIGIAVPFPHVGGHEFCGVVEEVGAGVKHFCKGMRVVALNSAPCQMCFYCSKHQENLCENLLFNNGAYAEYIKIPRRIVESNTLTIPPSVNFVEAAMVEPGCVEAEGRP